MSKLVEFARTELARLRNPNDEPDEIQDAIEANVMEITRLFANAGHSGGSAYYTLDILRKVLAFEPLTPLTGEDAEWRVLEDSDEIYAQNKRCGHVFKRRDGTAYDIDAESWRDITFPYTPTSIIVKRAAPQNKGNE